MNEKRRGVRKEAPIHSSSTSSGGQLQGYGSYPHLHQIAGQTQNIYGLYQASWTEPIIQTPQDLEHFYPTRGAAQARENIVRKAFEVARREKRIKNWGKVVKKIRRIRRLKRIVRELDQHCRQFDALDWTEDTDGQGYPRVESYNPEASAPVALQPEEEPYDEEQTEHCLEKFIRLLECVTRNGRRIRAVIQFLRTAWTVRGEAAQATLVLGLAYQAQPLLVEYYSR
jgi:hypothetical protein